MSLLAWAQVLHREARGKGNPLRLDGLTRINTVSDDRKLNPEKGSKMEVASTIFEETVGIATGANTIYGTLSIPEEAWGAVIFTQGSGCQRRNSRSLFVAEALHDVGIATLLVDLLTPSEERVDSFTACHRFNVGLLAERLLSATLWLERSCAGYGFSIGYFGASTGAAAALRAASECSAIPAIVSRGGRPELAGTALERVRAATLLIVGGLDRSVADQNSSAYQQLIGARQRELVVVPDATHLFEEKGALQEVAQLTSQWFVRYLGAATSGQSHEFRSPTERIRRALPR